MKKPLFSMYPPYVDFFSSDEDDDCYYCFCIYVVFLSSDYFFSLDMGVIIANSSNYFVNISCALHGVSYSFFDDVILAFEDWASDFSF